MFGCPSHRPRRSRNHWRPCEMAGLAVRLPPWSREDRGKQHAQGEAPDQSHQEEHHGESPANLAFATGVPYRPEFALGLALPRKSQSRAQRSTFVQHLLSLAGVAAARCRVDWWPLRLAPTGWGDTDRTTETAGSLCPVVVVVEGSEVAFDYVIRDRVAGAAPFAVGEPVQCGLRLANMGRAHLDTPLQNGVAIQQQEDFLQVRLL
jgi:hypothetical protein